jgi:hypothetical protein
VLEKVEVLGKLGRAMSTAAARLHFGVNKLTYYLIKENEDKIRGRIKVSTLLRAKISGISCCDSLLKNMEGLCVND